MPSKQNQSTPSRKIAGKEASNQQKEALQKSRKRILNEYSDRLSRIDSKVLDFVQKVINQTTMAYRTTVYYYTFSAVMLAIALIIGLYLILNPSQPNTILLASLCIFGGIIGLIYLQNRNPMKNVRYLVNNLVKLNVIFASFIRQIHQVDAIFEDILSTENKIDPRIVEDMLSHLQDSMAEAMDAVSRVSNDLDEQHFR